MPTISVKKYEIERLLNQSYDQNTFSNILFDFGLEVDDIEINQDGTTYKIEIPANRYDLLCAEGLANSLNSYLFSKTFEDIKLKSSSFDIVKQFTGKRSFIASAVIKNFNFDEISYNSFISYQEKLCGSLGRNRSLVSMGTHDFDKLAWPLTFKSIKKSDLDFTPLNCAHSVKSLEEHFENDKNIGKYLQYVEKDEYIVFEDSNNNIISVPPVINSNITKISLDTKNILIEVTGTNINKVNTCLKMFLSAFRTSEMYTVNIKDNTIIENNLSVDKLIDNIEDSIIQDNIVDINKLYNNKSYNNIQDNNKSYIITLKEVYNELNIHLSKDQLKSILIKMMYTTEEVDDKSIRVLVPTIRQDIIHKADVYEDIAICYGYNNIKMIMPDLNTIGSENRLNKFSDKIRLEMAMLGFIEVYTMVLMSKKDDTFEEKSCIVENYKSLECEVVRNTLYPGLMKSIASNLHCKIPIKIFEVGDIVLLNNKNDIGAINKRFLSCLYVGNKSHLEDVQGPLTMILDKCGVKNYVFESFDNEKKYLKNQSAILKIDGEVYGSIGVCNGDVLNKYKVPYSGSMLELNIEKIFEKFFK